MIEIFRAMMKNIYTPLSGGLSQQKLLDIIANNLANVNTTGFKEEKVTFSLLEAEPYDYKNPIPPANFKVDFMKVFPLKGNDQDYVGTSEIKRNGLQGTALQTDNPLDFMIEGEGFFTIRTLEGDRYSRAGNFSLSKDGVLVTPSGDPVMGEKGAILLSGSDFTVSADGEIYQGKQRIDRLLIKKFAHPETLEKVGSNYFFHTGAPEDETLVTRPTVTQGYLEGSNVNIIQNLTAMITAHRSYEAYQKAVKNFDQMMEKSSNSIGEVRA